jgi:hypothetical protein
VLVNGKRYPYTAFTPTWASGTEQDTSRVYASLMEYMGRYKGESDSGSLINPVNHRTLFPYYWFDLGTLDDLPSNSGYQISVEMNLSSSPGSNMTMYLTVLSDTKFNIVGGEQGLQVIQA